MFCTEDVLLFCLCTQQNTPYTRLTDKLIVSLTACLLIILSILSAAITPYQHHVV